MHCYKNTYVKIRFIPRMNILNAKLDCIVLFIFIL